jgi:RHS repeat-associated protein
MSYLYDGDGKRVEKCTQGTTPGTCATNATGTLYWMGWTDEVGAESDLTGSVTQNYIFFNGQRIARRDASTGNIHYYFSDHLGTHSLVTDANGTMPPQEESDFYPFGGEIPVSGSDTNHYKFTGKERDAESGLDNFGARYNASNLGRFMTPDWAAKPTSVPYAKFGDPQTLNLYSYVENEPSTGQMLTATAMMTAPKLR